MPESSGPARTLRADARRNHERILDATRDSIAEVGPGFAVDDVAARAGVAVATLYRRFGSRRDLIRAAFERFATDEVTPLVTAAVRGPDPWQGLVDGLEATVLALAGNAPLAAAAQDAGVVADAVRFMDPLGQALRRAQEGGAARPDLTPDDLPVLIAMVVTTMVQYPGPDAGRAWRRYLALLLDGSRAGPSHRLLPPM
jgi:AcrR family transcriptional regulator